MASKEEMEIIIHKDGTVSGEVMKGPGGAGCVSNLEEILGGLGSSFQPKKKPEFYVQSTVNKQGAKR